MNLLTRTPSRFIPSSILIFVLILSGCGGGGGGSTSPDTTPTSTASSVASSSGSSSSSLGVSTTYKVSVHVPESFPSNDGSTKKTNVQLNANNFALVSVSLSGVVIERYTIKPADIAKTNDGDWTITAPGTPRADTVIVADITKAIDLPATDTIKTEGLVYAPTTAEVVDIDVGSTSAYKNLITELGGSGTFASQGVDPANSKNVVAVENLVNSVQTIVADEDLSGKTTVAAALAVVEEPVNVVVKQEVINIKNHAVGTAVSLIRDEGGLFWYNTEEEDIMRGALIGMSAMTIERYENNKFVAKTPDGHDDRIVLSPSGWVPSKDTLKISAYNDDGSVTTQDTAYDSVGGTLSIKQAFDLSGRNIVEFLQSTTNARGMTSIVNPTAVFASGAKGYRGNTVELSPIYNVFFVPGDANGKCWGLDANLPSASGGNCMSMDMRSGEARTYSYAVSGYSKLFSPDVAINTKDYRAIVMGNVGPNFLEVQIINDANKTLKFYENSSAGDGKLIATSTWSEITLPYLTSDNKAIHFTYPQSVFEAASVWSGEHNPEVYIAQQDGYLRPIFTVVEEPNDESVFFNAIANTSITNAAAGYTNPLVGNWKLGEDTFIFSDNNTFTHVKAFSDDPNCLAGSATGTYSWNSLTSMLHVELQTDSTASDTTDSCSVDGKFKLTLSGNQITFTADDEPEPYIFTKTNSSAGLVGTWVFGTASDYAILLFTDTQYFLSDYNDEDGYGTESGTYVYNAGTGQLTATVLRDGNGNEGFSNGGSVPLVIAGDNQSFTAGDGNLFKRLE